MNSTIIRKRGLIILGLIMLAIMIGATTVVLAQDSYWLTITDVRTADTSGASKTSFIRGEMVNVIVTVNFPLNYDADPTVTFLGLVRIDDPSDRMIILTSAEVTISQEETKSYSGAGMLSLDAPLGPYNAKAMVWNGWISVVGADWAPYAADETVGFNVVSG